MVVVDQDIYPIEPIGTEIADIVLPAAGWGEESFARANGERRISLYSKLNDAPGEAKADWWIAAAFGRKTGYKGSAGRTPTKSSRRRPGSGASCTSYWPLVWYAKNKTGMSGHEYLRSPGDDGYSSLRALPGRPAPRHQATEQATMTQEPDLIMQAVELPSITRLRGLWTNEDGFQHHGATDGRPLVVALSPLFPSQAMGNNAEESFNVGQGRGRPEIFVYDNDNHGNGTISTKK